MTKRRSGLPIYAIVLAVIAASPSYAQLISFQQGVNGYSGTLDAEFRTDFVTTPTGEAPFISIDQNDGSTSDQTNRTQGAMRFEDIFGAGAGQVPLDEEILFAEIVVFVQSQTAADAVVSFNRILGDDQPDPEDETPRNRAPGIWREDDTWFSLGGSVIPEVNPDNPEVLILPNDPISVGTSATLAVGNEAVASPEAGAVTPFDGILEPQFNLVDDDFASIEVTGALKAWQAGAPNAGWAINSTSGNGWDFIASEFSIANLPAEDQAGAQAQLDALGLTEEQVRPQLNVVVGVSGDLDYDGDIDPDDYSLLRASLGNVFATRGDVGDLDFDFDVDLEDFVRFKSVYDTQNGAGAFDRLVAGAPEPMSMVLTLVGVCLLPARRRG